MNKFFHNYPICPNCLAPLIEFTNLKMTDKKKNSFKCGNCGAHFYNRFADDKFKESLLSVSFEIN